MNAISRQVQEELVADSAEGLVSGVRSHYGSVLIVQWQLSPWLGCCAAMSYADMAVAARRVSAASGRWRRSEADVAAIWATRSAVGWSWPWAATGASGRQRRSASPRSSGRHPGRRRRAAARPAHRAVEGEGSHPDRKDGHRRGARDGPRRRGGSRRRGVLQALEYAGQFAKGPPPPTPPRSGDRRRAGFDLRTGLDSRSEVFAALFATDDQRIGMTSFIDNGPGKAKFTGR